MIRKRFDRALYEKYDKLARKYAKAEIESLGYKVEDNPRKTGVDLIVKDGSRIIFYVECEIKTALDKPFHYQTLQLPERKLKFCGKNYPTLFMLFSSDGEKYFCVWDKFVQNSPMREVYNKYVSSNEFFFQIPIADCNKNIKDVLKRKWRRLLD